ncbi:MAG: valine--tRNA ligase [Candidatus Omnitrophica bacterium]|nr:valine--tRNA ligase [Candidatus Omnitrophota bacterium]
MAELAPRYNPHEVEKKWYELWESKGFFTPKIDSKKKPYVIVIPPPNVTGILHMGHALNNTIQDILIRWHRMKGEPTLWVPGTDHAGIATQNVVEKKLAKEGKTRQQLGREKFIEEVWKWKEEHGSTITHQLRRLGASCDWTRERFTMDEGLSKAVREAFTKLHKKGLIYQGNYIINWCPRCQTALSDEEAPYTETEGKLYYYYYLVKDSKTGKLTKEGAPLIATTRPETMLGDIAIAVNPKDERYKGIEKKEIYLPLQNRPLHVIKDDFVDPEFGTGVVKVTPAHDPNDFEMAIRHNLEQRNILYPDARINENGKPYEGLDRFEARKRIIEDLKKEGLFDKEISHKHTVPHCYRCHTVVEPYLSKQWFVKMRPLAERALKAHAEGKVKITPERWNKVYTNWLEGIRDWCISRQIWWGHPIPIEGDKDVLDTWFSSWLWPFSTLGWPQKTKELQYFYPTSDLVTAPEILFFWVARMIMAGLEFMGEVPFKNVLIHGTVRAQSGLKMSKSLGNAIDPLEVIDEIGADALRQSLIMLAAQDVYLSKEKFEVGKNFTNKIWNAARFVFMNLQDFKKGTLDPDFDFRKLAPVHRWILSRLEEVTHTVEESLGRFALSQAATELYHFVWGKFCDWYIELVKPALTGADKEAKLQTQKVLFFVLERTLRLLHPYMPFITEEIWQKLREIAKDKKKWPQTLMFASWPFDQKKHYQDSESEESFRVLEQAVDGIRELRANLGIPPGQRLKAVIRPKSDHVAKALDVFEKEIAQLTRLESLEFKKDFQRSKSWLGTAHSDLEVFIQVEGVIDPEKEKARIERKIQECEKYLDSIRKKLENPSFVANAPEELVAEEQGKLLNLESLLKTHQEHLSLFSQ